MAHINNYNLYLEGPNDDGRDELYVPTSDGFKQANSDDRALLLQELTELWRRGITPIVTIFAPKDWSLRKEKQ